MLQASAVGVARRQKGNSNFKIDDAVYVYVPTLRRSKLASKRSGL